VEPLRHEFRLSDAQIGALVTWFTIVFAVAGLPLGRLADKASRRWLLAVGVAAWGGLTGLAGLASSYAMLLVTRLGVGIGEAVCAPVATSWIADIVPAGRRAKAMAGFMLAIPVGGLLSYSLTGPLAQAYGWRFALAVAAAPVIVLAPGILWLSEPESGSGLGRQGSGWRGLGIGFWWIAASGAVINFALYGLSTFLPAYLTRYHEVSVAQAGVWMGVGTGLSGIAGAGAVWALGDRVRNRLCLAAAASILAALPLFAAVRLAPGMGGASVWLAMLGYGLLQMYYGLAYAAIQDRVQPSLRATAMAVYLVVTYLGGASWGPVVMGGASDLLARRAAGIGPVTEAARAAGLHGAMYLIPALAVVLGWVLWMAARRTA